MLEGERSVIHNLTPNIFPLLFVELFISLPGLDGTSFKMLTTNQNIFEKQSRLKNIKEGNMYFFQGESPI